MRASRCGGLLSTMGGLIGGSLVTPLFARRLPASCQAGDVTVGYLPG
jgi:hypothetical protein